MSANTASGLRASTASGGVPGSGFQVEDTSKWKDVGKPRENDFFPKVPWWLRVWRWVKP
jgi:hypothetical protein